LQTNPQEDIMIKATVLLLLAAAVIYILVSCSKDQASPSHTTNSSTNLALTINNNTQQTLWVDIIPGNTRISPSFSSLKSQQTIDITITPSSFGGTTSALNFYQSPAKLNKKAIIAIRNYQVFVRQCPGCKVTQPDRNHAQVTISP